MWRLSVTVALAGCGAKKVDHVVLDISVIGNTPLGGAKLELDDHDVGVLVTSTTGGGNVEVSLPPVERTLNTFALIVPTPCGDTRIALEHAAGGRREITSVELAPVNGGGVYVALQVPDGKLSSYGVPYDNRHGKTVALTIGKLAVSVPANSKGVLPVWEPTCAKPVAITVDGRALDVAQGAFADQCGAAPVQVFLGLAAKCYVVHAVPYELALEPLPNTTAPPTETRLAGHDAYVVPDVRYVMETAPARIETDDARDKCLRDIVECGER